MADTRRYDSVRRLAQAQRTRADIAGAARELFVARGWAATTVRDVARAAGVSVPTVYAAYQNKAGLVRALADAADLSADLPRMVDELEATTSPADQIAAMVAYDRRLFSRSGDLIALVRDAARTEPELAGLYAAAREVADSTRVSVFSAWPAGTLAVPLDMAVDVYAALCNVDVLETLTGERGWSPERVEEWWVAVLCDTCLARPADT